MGTVAIGKMPFPLLWTVRGRLEGPVGRAYGAYGLLPRRIASLPVEEGENERQKLPRARWPPLSGRWPNRNALPFRFLICPAGPWKRPWLSKMMSGWVMALGRWRSPKGSVTGAIGSSAYPKSLRCGQRPATPPLATPRLLIGAVSHGQRLTHHDASGHVPAGEEGERAGVLRSA